MIEMTQSVSDTFHVLKNFWNINLFLAYISQMNYQAAPHIPGQGVKGNPPLWSSSTANFCHDRRVPVIEGSPPCSPCSGVTDHRHVPSPHRQPPPVLLLLVSPLGGIHRHAHWKVQLRWHFLLLFSFRLRAPILLFPAGAFPVTQPASSASFSVFSFCF